MALLAAALGGCAVGTPPQRFESKRVCMGVQTRVVIYAGDQQTADEAARAAYERIAELEQVMSDYRASSELMRLCARAGEGPVRVSEDLFDVLRLSERISRDSHGAFDVTVGPAVALWREARRAGRLPPGPEHQQAMALVDWRNLALDERDRTAALAVAGMRLDLGGIGKGYAAQRAVEVIRARGLPRCMVALAGDIVVGQPPPGRKGWEIEIAGGQGGSDDARETISLVNAAVSTSGDTEQFIEIDGRRYSHIVDPRTGVGIEGGMSVTVIAASGEMADALATAVCVLGPDEGPRLIRRTPGVAAVLERATDGSRDVERTVVESGRRVSWTRGRK